MLRTLGFPLDSDVNLPETWETTVQLLGGEESLEKELVTHSGILA